MNNDKPDLVGTTEIADRLGVRHRTVQQWRFRHRLPEPLAVVAGRVPVWEWAEIEAWAKATGRGRRPS